MQVTHMDVPRFILDGGWVGLPLTKCRLDRILMGPGQEPGPGGVIFPAVPIMGELTGDLGKPFN